jgi:hypothetical protein
MMFVLRVSSRGLGNSIVTAVFAEWEGDLPHGTL